MKTDKKLFDALVAELATQVPGFSIKYKSESALHQIMGKLLKWVNPHYLTSVTTTSSPNVWFPNPEFVSNDYKLAFRVLAHEAVHLLDQRNPLFKGLYMFPQIFGLIGFLGIFGVMSPVCFWALLAFLALLPFPAPWRTYYELRGYTMTLAVDYWQNGYTDAILRAHVEKQFCSSTYWFMFPFSGWIRRIFDRKLLDVVSGTHQTQDKLSQTVYNILKSKGT